VKRILISLILIFAVVFSISAEGDNPPTIAIMDVAATNTSEVKSQVIYEYIVDVVNRANRYTLVERSALQAALKEMEISSSGMVDDSTAAEIGKLAGAKLILISNLIMDDGITYLSARIVAVETGQVSDTAMLQMEEGEYIASLANRTISQLLGVVEEETETESVKEVVEEKSKDDSVKKEGKQDSDSEEPIVETVDSSNKSLTLGGIGILPVEKEGEEIFDIGYGLKVDLDYKVLKMGASSLTLGAGTGLFYDASKSEIDVIYPFNLFSFPLVINLKYNLVMGKIFVTFKVGGGGTLNMFMYRDTVPDGVDSTLISLNAAVIPGLAIGYKLSDKIGLSLFADGSMTFFTARPYTAINAGLAIDIKL